MTTKSMAYDHAAYLVRIPFGSGSNVANTSFSNHVAFTAMNALSATFTVITAGTSAAGNLWVVNKISGTTTTALATATLGTSAAGTVINIPLSTAAGGAAMLQGDIIFTAKGTDTVGISTLGYEMALQPLANITA